MACLKTTFLMLYQAICGELPSAAYALNAAGETTEALKGHRVLWKIEICYLIRMT